MPGIQCYAFQQVLLRANMTKSQAISEDVNQQLRAFRKARKSFKGSPAKARSWLIRMGILDKSGTRLAKKYR
jgi:hypothetical protein